MWARAVWTEEDNRTFIDCIPSNWISNKHVRWPPQKVSQSTSQRMLRTRANPTKDWQWFDLVKVKFTTDDKHEAKNRVYDTSGVESCTDDSRLKNSAYVSWDNYQDGPTSNGEEVEFSSNTKSSEKSSPG